jgi:hypothetical protein
VVSAGVIPPVIWCIENVHHPLGKEVTSCDAETICDKLNTFIYESMDWLLRVNRQIPVGQHLLEFYEVCKIIPELSVLQVS